MISSIQYHNQDIKDLILQSILRLDRTQQVKLLEFVNSLVSEKKQENNLLSYAGYFSKKELKEMKEAITDCEKIDYDEW